MTELIACCGLVCETCPIYLVSRENDRVLQETLRADIARLVQQQYGLACAPEAITDCDGCRAEGGRLFPVCLNCSIRGCARAKGIDNCARCGEYPCSKLEPLLASEPAARARLDAIRQGSP